MLSRFRRAESGGPAFPEEELEELLADAAAAPPELRGPLYNRAADLAAAGAPPVLTRELYGKCIDAYLLAGRYQTAAAVCRKLLAFAPGVVRAHCTLAFIALGMDQPHDARRAIAAYAQAAERTRTHQYAIPRLHMMARATRNLEVRAAILEALEQLGDRTTHRIAVPLAEPSPHEDRWKELLAIAVMDASELWTHSFSRSRDPAPELDRFAPPPEVDDARM
jgi:hypothetical protein